MLGHFALTAAAADDQHTGCAQVVNEQALHDPAFPEDPDGVRLHLTRERRVAIKQWFESHVHDQGLVFAVIEKGHFRALADHETNGPFELVRHLQSLAELGKIITM